MSESAISFRSALFPIYAFFVCVSFPLTLAIVIVREGLSADLAEIVGAAVGTAAMALPVAALVAFLPITISPTGVRCYSFWGLPKTIAWKQISSVRPFNLLGLRFLVVGGEATCKIYLPLFLADMRLFREEVRRLAGSENVLAQALGAGNASPDETLGMPLPVRVAGLIWIMVGGTSFLVASMILLQTLYGPRGRPGTDKTLLSGLLLGIILAAGLGGVGALTALGKNVGIPRLGELSIISGCFGLCGSVVIHVVIVGAGVPGSVTWEPDLLNASLIVAGVLTIYCQRKRMDTSALTK